MAHILDRKQMNYLALPGSENTVLIKFKRCKDIKETTSDHSNLTLNLIRTGSPPPPGGIGLHGGG